MRVGDTIRIKNFTSYMNGRYAVVKEMPDGGASFFKCEVFIAGREQDVYLVREEMDAPRADGSWAVY